MKVDEPKVLVCKHPDYLIFQNLMLTFLASGLIIIILLL